MRYFGTLKSLAPDSVEFQRHEWQSNSPIMTSGAHPQLGQGALLTDRATATGTIFTDNEPQRNKLRTSSTGWRL